MPTAPGLDIDALGASVVDETAESVRPPTIRKLLAANFGAYSEKVKLREEVSERLFSLKTPEAMAARAKLLNNPRLRKLELDIGNPVATLASGGLGAVLGGAALAVPFGLLSRLATVRAKARANTGYGDYGLANALARAAISGGLSGAVVGGSVGAGLHLKKLRNKGIDQMRQALKEELSAAQSHKNKRSPNVKTSTIKLASLNTHVKVAYALYVAVSELPAEKRAGAVKAISAAMRGARAGFNYGAKGARKALPTPAGHSPMVKRDTMYAGGAAAGRAVGRAAGVAKKHPVATGAAVGGAAAGTAVASGKREE